MEELEKSSPKKTNTRHSIKFVPKCTPLLPLETCGNPDNIIVSLCLSGTQPG